MSALELMKLHVEALYTFDALGRMLRVNEPGGKGAPLFHMGKTRDGNWWRFGAELPETLDRELEEICRAEPASVERVPRGRDSIVRVVSKHVEIQTIGTGPAYWFERDMPRTADVLPVTRENAALLKPNFADWFDELASGGRQPFFARFVDGKPVAVCGSVRITAAAHEAGVRTLPEFRGRGYASDVTAAWARAVRALGAVPMYSTSWENAASQGVAQKLGLSMYGTDFHAS